MKEEDLKVLDRDGALARLGGDEELYEEVLSLYFEDMPIQIKNLEEALRENMRDISVRIVHSMKSASAGVGAEALRAYCASIEAELVAGVFKNIEEGIRTFVSELARVKNLVS